jgi:hypothetical protein
MAREAAFELVESRFEADVSIVQPLGGSSVLIADPSRSEERRPRLALLTTDLVDRALGGMRVRQDSVVPIAALVAGSAEARVVAFSLSEEGVGLDRQEFAVEPVADGLSIVSGLVRVLDDDYAAAIQVVAFDGTSAEPSALTIPLVRTEDRHRGFPMSGPVPAMT